MVDLTVEVREEPVKEVVLESPIWDREEELSMDNEEDGRANEVVYCLHPNLLSQYSAIFLMSCRLETLSTTPLTSYSSRTLLALLPRLSHLPNTLTVIWNSSATQIVTLASEVHLPLLLCFPITLLPILDTTFPHSLHPLFEPTSHHT